MMFDPLAPQVHGARLEPPSNLIVSYHDVRSADLYIWKELDMH